MDVGHDLTFAVVIVDIAIVLAGASLMGAVARRVGQPPVVGEIAAGIMLGPSLLGLLPGDLTGRLFPADARPYLAAIAHIGLVLFMFLIGWEFNAQLLRRGSAAVISVSLTAMATSFLLGLGAAALLYQRHRVVDGEPVSFASFGSFLGIALAITAFPVLARILSDSGLQQTRVGALVLASAAIQDLLAWILLAGVLAGLTSATSLAAGAVVGYLLLYALLMLVLVRPLLHRVTTHLTRDGRASPYLIPVIGTGVFLSAAATSWIGVHEIIGAFAFGLVMPRGPRELLARQVREPFEAGTQLLLPIFFVVTGLSVDIGALGAAEVLELLLLAFAACAGKLVGAGAPARLCGMSWRDAYSVGLLMNTRGLTELVILNIGVTFGVLDHNMFTMLVIIALATTAMAGPLLPRDLTRDLTRVTRSEPGGSHAKKSTVAA